MKVGVFGAGGRMGSEVCRAVSADPALELVAAVDPHHAGLDLRSVTGVDVPGMRTDADAGALARAGAEVAVDFTDKAAAMENLAWCAANGVHAVVGTTGFTAADLDLLRSLFSGDTACFIAPNFAIGAVLMIRCAELAAPYFETAEIIELHHDHKVDAPSGTAMYTAERIAAASDAWAADPTRSIIVEGARGGRGAGGIPIHSVRMRGMVAHQEVLFGTTGQTLSIRHDTTDRTSFMPGVVLAVKSVAHNPGLTIGLDVLLGLRGVTVEEVLGTDHIWYHTVELGNGQATPGRVDLRPYVEHARFPDDLSGTRALDVGTFDGFWAFELERRGADVVAIDTETIPWPDTPAKFAPSIEPSVAETGFRLLHRHLGSSVDYRLVPTAELTVDAIGGPVDLAFVGAILLHLQNPLAALERIRSVLTPGGRIVVMEPVDGPLTETHPNEPVARWLAEAVKISLWYPNAMCLRQWLETAGFVDVEEGERVWYTDTAGDRQLTQTLFARNP